MPRGNDVTAALAELNEKFGRGVGNAEELIAAAKDAVSPKLRAAQNKAVDADATAALDLKAVARAAGERNPILAATVRVSGDVVYVARAQDGRAYKDVVSVADIETSRPAPAKEAEQEQKPKKPQRGKKAEDAE